MIVNFCYFDVGSIISVHVCIFMSVSVFVCASLVFAGMELIISCVFLDVVIILFGLEFYFGGYSSLGWYRFLFLFLFFKEGRRYFCPGPSSF